MCWKNRPSCSGKWWACFNPAELEQPFYLSYEFWGALLGLAYLIEAARQKRACWLYGGISSLIYLYVFYDARLYVDVALNAYYVAVAFVGWFGWRRKEDTLPVTRLKWGQLLGFILAALALGAFLGYALKKFTNADYPLEDSFIGALAVMATWLTARKKIETWAFWIVADACAAVLYFYKELYFTSALMAIYCVLVVVAWLRWHKDLNHAAA